MGLFKKLKKAVKKITKPIKKIAKKVGKFAGKANGLVNIGGLNPIASAGKKLAKDPVGTVTSTLGAFLPQLGGITHGLSGVVQKVGDYAQYADDFLDQFQKPKLQKPLQGLPAEAPPAPSSGDEQQPPTPSAMPYVLAGAAVLAVVLLTRRK